MISLGMPWIDWKRKVKKYFTSTELLQGLIFLVKSYQSLWAWEWRPWLCAYTHWLEDEMIVHSGQWTMIATIIETSTTGTSQNDWPIRVQEPWTISYACVSTYCSSSCCIPWSLNTQRVAVKQQYTVVHSNYTDTRQVYNILCYANEVSGAQVTVSTVALHTVTALI